MSIESDQAKSKITEFWLKYEQKIIVLAGIVIIAAICYEAGYIQGRKNQEKPMIINQIASDNTEGNDTQKENTIPAKNNSSQTDNSESTKQSENQITSQTNKQTCAFVASKSSDKYHLSTCAWAKKIKPENNICFSSKEEAESRGYQPAKCCIK